MKEKNSLKLGVQKGIYAPLAKANFEQYTKLTVLGKGELDQSGITELTFKGRHV